MPQYTLTSFSSHPCLFPGRVLDGVLLLWLPQMLGKETVILAAALENEICRKLEAIPELNAALPVIRRLYDGDELWLFVVLQEQLEPDLAARIISVPEGTMDRSIIRCRIYQLSMLPVTRSGRMMRRAIERFVNHLAVPNRLRMRNPEVLGEIAHVAGFAAEGGPRDDAPLSPLFE